MNVQLWQIFDILKSYKIKFKYMFYFSILIFLCFSVIFFSIYLAVSKNIEKQDKMRLSGFLIVLVLVTFAISPVGILFLMLFKSIFYLPASYIDSYQKNNPIECKGVISLKNPFYNEESFSLRELSEYSNFGIKEEDGVYRVIKPYGEVKRCIKVQADQETFVVIDKYYAKDKDNAYLQKRPSGAGVWSWHVITNIDSDSFVTFENDSYAKDKNHVYLDGKIIQEADQSSFEAFFTSKINNKVQYDALDDISFYYGGRIVGSNISKKEKQIDANGLMTDDIRNTSQQSEGNTQEIVDFTMQEIDVYFSKDSNNVYFIDPYSGEKKIIDNVDVETFIQGDKCKAVEMSFNYYYRDKNKTYRLEELLTNKYDDVPIIDHDTYEYLGFVQSKPGTMPYGNAYAKDKNHIYYACGEVLEGVDRDTFEIVGNGFVKDENNVYEWDDLVEGVDPSKCTKTTIEECKL